MNYVVLNVHDPPVTTGFATPNDSSDHIDIPDCVTVDDTIIRLHHEQ